MEKKTNRKFDEGDIVRLTHPMYGEFVGELAVIVKVFKNTLSPSYAVRLYSGVEVVVDGLTVEGVTLDELRREAGDKLGPSWRTIIDELPEGDEEARRIFQAAVRAAEEQELAEAAVEVTVAQASSERMFFAVVPGAACWIALFVILILAALGKLTTFGIVLGFIALMIAGYLTGRVLLPLLIIGNSETRKARARVEELKKNRKEK